MIFCCQETNDLYRVLHDLGHSYPRYDTLAEGLKAALPGAGVLALADDYPRPGWVVDGRLLAFAAEKRVRLYLEYPASLPGIVLGEPRATHWERVVVSSGFFAPDLDQFAILAQHGCWFLPLGGEIQAGDPSRGSGSTLERILPGEGDRDTPGDRVLEADADPLVPKPESPRFAELPEGEAIPLVVARVAGYNRAVYGLPETASPILFRLPGRDVWVATSKLSQFVTGRYGPREAWKAIWERLLRWLEPDGEPLDLAWTPTVGVEASRDGELDEEAEARALRHSVRWFNEQVVTSIDWKKGAIEGFESAIDHEGRQRPRTWPRGDCTGETGMVFAYDWALSGNPASRRLAGQILDYVWSADFCHDDPRDPAYGLNNWFERGPVFYGDDNARVIIPTLVSRELLGDERWDERAMRCLLANLRTTGALGFRRNRIDLSQLVEPGQGWAFFEQEETISYAPHYQAYLWAAYLLAYTLTGHDEFLDKTKTAIGMTMDVYPRWRWTNGISQEMARMLLPLAFLVQIEDTEAHRDWLRRIVDDLLALMQPCGAIREQLGPLDTGRYAPPQSNEAYGTAEASLIQANGDPACDLLYTTNYAFVGLHEATAAARTVGWLSMADTLQEAEDRLASFLCRIQVRSRVHPYLEGAWMRSFDYERWEYWGSSADLGWGAWSVESGWTNTWIAAVLAMRRLDRSLFDIVASKRVGEPFSRSLAEMLGRH